MDLSRAEEFRIRLQRLGIREAQAAKDLPIAAAYFSMYMNEPRGLPGWFIDKMEAYLQEKEA